MAFTQNSFDSVQGATPSSATSSKIILGLVVLYLVSYPVYALYLHPLSSFPGGTIEKLTRLPYWIACIVRFFGIIIFPFWSRLRSCKLCFSVAFGSRRLQSAAYSNRSGDN